MKYRRDHFGHFLLYWADFFFLNPLKVPLYFARAKRPKLVRRYLLGELSWLVVVGVALAVAPWPTCWVFVMPFLLMRFLIVCGDQERVV